MQLVYTIIVFLAFGYSNAQGRIVDTSYGPVQGVDVNMANGDVIESWLAVPYAKPPVGDLRFEVRAGIRYKEIAFAIITQCNSMKKNIICVDKNTCI